VLLGRPLSEDVGVGVVRRSGDEVAVVGDDEGRHGGERPEPGGRRLVAFGAMVGGVAALLGVVVVASQWPDRSDVSTTDAAMAAMESTRPVDVGGVVQPTSTAVESTTSTTNAAQSPEWDLEGERFKASFRANMRDGLYMGMYPLDTMTNPGEWAFQSEPVHISGPGTYDLRFALPTGFTMRGFSLRLPPDFTVAATWTAPPSGNSDDGTGVGAGPDGFFHIELIVPDAGQPVSYPDLTAWLQ
jgi:hypothetical protein